MSNLSREHIKDITERLFKISRELDVHALDLFAFGSGNYSLEPLLEALNVSYAEIKDLKRDILREVSGA